jgi:hypothetical protein
LRLSGWSKARRVVVLRWRIKQDIALTSKGAGKKRGQHEANEQLVLALPHNEVQDSAQVWEYTVLATNASYDIAAIGQLYRDRCCWLPWAAPPAAATRRRCTSRRCTPKPP